MDGDDLIFFEFGEYANEIFGGHACETGDVFTGDAVLDEFVFEDYIGEINKCIANAP